MIRRVLGGDVHPVSELRSGEPLTVVESVLGDAAPRGSRLRQRVGAEFVGLVARLRRLELHLIALTDAQARNPLSGRKSALRSFNFA